MCIDLTHKISVPLRWKQPTPGLLYHTQSWTLSVNQNSLAVEGRREWVQPQSFVGRPIILRCNLTEYFRLLLSVGF
jgi:hypothetical protein